MDIKYFGGNCIKLQTKKASVVIDDNLDQLGLANITKTSDISVSTIKGSNFLSSKNNEFNINKPGEYEVLDTSIKGISATAHIDEPGVKNAVIYRIILDDIRVAVLGHIYPDLSEDQLESLGMVDVLIIPVGGRGYTLDGIGALKLIKKIGPKIVIPTHYSDSKVKYEVPQDDIESVRKTLSMEPAEEEQELKIKGRDFAEGTKLVILKRQ